MKKGILAIYDYETDYANHLMDYLNRKCDFVLEARVFTNSECIMEHLIENTIEILLIGEDISFDGNKIERVKNIIILSERTYMNERTTYPVIYKFQSAEYILRELLAHYTKQRSFEESTKCFLGGGNGKLIGIISPSGGSGKSTFAIALGQALAREKRVLLLNLESVPGQYCKEEEKMTGSSGMSDLIYYIKQNKSDIAPKLSSMVRKIGELDYVLPADHYSDLYEINKEDVVSLVEKLKSNSSYDIILLDIGYLHDSVFEFLKSCDKVYMPMVGDLLSKGKEEAFRKVFKTWEGEKLLEQVTRVQIPFDEELARGDYLMEHLCSGKLGDFVFQLLANGGLL